jgi:hypothetical protein
MVGARLGGSSSGDIMPFGEVEGSGGLDIGCLPLMLFLAAVILERRPAMLVRAGLGGVRMCVQGGTEIAMFKAIFPPAENPEIASRDGSKVIVFLLVFAVALVWARTIA